MNCNDSCKPGFIPGPPAPNYASGCSLAENPTFKTYVLPASVGTDAPGQPYAPKIGEFRNAIVIYEANNNIYIYDSLGTPTLMEKGDYNSGGPTPTVSVVQTTGTSTTSVMSQNAVTNELNSISAEITKTNNTVANLSGDVNNNTATINSLNSEVTWIQETGIPTIQGNITALSNEVSNLEKESIEVVQESGDSTIKVMSQNAVTKALDQKQATLIGFGAGQNIARVQGKNLMAPRDIQLVTSVEGNSDDVAISQYTFTNFAGSVRQDIEMINNLAEGANTTAAAAMQTAERQKPITFTQYENGVLTVSNSEFTQPNVFGIIAATEPNIPMTAPCTAIRVRGSIKIENPGTTAQSIPLQLKFEISNTEIPIETFAIILDPEGDPFTYDIDRFFYIPMPMSSNASITLYGRSPGKVTIESMDVFVGKLEDLYA